MGDRAIAGGTWLDATPLLLADLSHAYTPGNPASIDFGLELGASYVQVRENGVYRPDAPLSSTDTLRVAVTGGVITYAKNGTVFYRSGAVPVYPLVAAASLANGSAAIGGAVLATASAGGPVV